MEIEKPFKCSVCSARFTNEGHLEVHKKRHVMSLNLSKGSMTANIPDGFVDETPTPTRFIRNCEEVGLFQDLQNVNPFDLQFTKAASATPSTEQFEFNFSTSSKKGVDDTLNTPQLCTTGHPMGFAYTASTPIASVQNSTTPSSSTDHRIVEVETISVACTAEDTHVESTTPDNETDLSLQLFPTDDISSTNSSPSRSKLRLNFISDEKNSPNLLSDSMLSSNDMQEDILYYEEDEDEILKPVSSKKSRKSSAKSKKVESLEQELKERNRAAASRSRERRKQWVSMLEDKCKILEQSLSQTQNVVAKLRAENFLLREEIGRHANCDVTKAESKQNKIQDLATGLSKVSESQPQDAQKHSASSPASVSQPGKIKRGRPKKGCEKRVEVSLPPPSTTKSPAIAIPPIRISPRGSGEAPIKVEILPMKSIVGQQVTNVYVLKRGS